MLPNAHPVKIRMQRLGWQFVFVGVFAMVGGAVRAFNLPFVLAGLIVGTLILHWRWVRHTAAHGSVVRQLPIDAFAGEPFEVRFWVRNHSRWLPAWLLRIDDRIGRVEADGRRDWLGKTHDLLEAPTEARCGLGVVARRQSRSVGYRCTVSKRGRYDFGPLRLSTAAPLGLLAAEVVDRHTDSFYVFPQRISLSPNWQRILRSQLGGGTTRGAAAGVDTGDFFGIRDWQQGDSRRQIHWRTTARINQLAVRQYEQQRRYDVGVIVDAHYVAAIARRPQTDGQEAVLEFLLSTAGALLLELSANSLNRVSLAVAGSQVQTASLGGGRGESLSAALRLLAEVSPSPTADVAGGVQRLMRRAGRLRDLIVLSTRTSEQALESSARWRQLTIDPSAGRVAWFSTADGSIGQLAPPPPPLATDGAPPSSDAVSPEPLPGGVKR